MSIGLLYWSVTFPNVETSKPNKHRVPWREAGCFLAGAPTVCKSTVAAAKPTRRLAELLSPCFLGKGVGLGGVEGAVVG